MRKPLNPAASPVEVTIDYAAILSSWLGIALALTLGALLLSAKKILEVLSSPARPLLFIVGSSCLLIGLLVFLKNAPLFFRFDKPAGLITYGRLGYPWKIHLPAQEVTSQLTRQTSHSGITHFLVLSVNNKQLLHIKAGTWWPLSRLATLEQLLNSKK